MVKRKRRGRRQAREQSRKLTQNDQAKKRSGSLFQQVETKAQPAATLKATQETPPPPPPILEETPVQMLAKKKKHEAQKEAAVVQRQLVNKA